MPVLLVVCLCLAVSNAGAAYTTPSKVPIQGRLTNVSTGAALSGSYVFTFRVYNASTGETKLWEENQSLVLDSGGLWSTFLGNNTPLDFSFSEDIYIEMEINHDSDPLPRVQLATVPYSKRTDIAANLSCVDCIGGAEINESTLSGVNAAQLGGQASDYYLNTSTPFGGDVSGAYNSMEVNASKIDTGTLNRSYIEDSYLLNIGDNATGNYSFDSGTLYVDSSNHRIGIGTSTPSYKLEVIGGVNVTGNLTTPLVCLNGDCRSNWPTGSGISSAGGWVNTSTETYSALNVNLSNMFFFNSSSGYVGIGTASLGYPLNVRGYVKVGADSDGEYGYLWGNPEILWNFYKTSGSTDLNLFSYGGGGNVMAFKADNGNVGIGSTNPSEKFNVNGSLRVDNSTGSAVLFVNASNGYVGIGTTNPFAALSVGSTSQFQVSSTGAVTAASINGNNITAGTGTLTIGAGKTFNASNTLTLTATDGSILAIGAGGTLGTGAYVAIADYAPLASPNFTGTITIPSPFTLGATSVTANGTELNYVDGVTSAIQTQLNAKAPTASPTFTGSVTMPGSGIWNSSGNVGIGTTSPNYTLHVAGNSSFNSPITVNGTYNPTVPIRGIIMYSGNWSFDATGLGTGSLIGWALCNGLHGTPNLTNTFAMGANSSTMNTRGGANSFTLSTSQMPSHTHTISTDGSHSHSIGWEAQPIIGTGEGVWGVGSGSSGWYSGYIASAGSHGHGGATGSAGSGSSIDNRPSYVAVAYIMKI